MYAAPDQDKSMFLIGLTAAGISGLIMGVGLVILWLYLARGCG